MHKHKNIIQIALSVGFIAFVAWWASFQHVVAKQGLSAQWFEGTYGLMALAAAVIGISAARKWGGWKTVLGKSLWLFTLGSFAQEAGQLIYQYYIYGAKVDIPYPSFGDIAYFGSVLLYIGAAFYLTKAAGAHLSLKNHGYKLIAIAIPVILLSLSYWIFLNHHQYDTHKPVTVFLDFGYPMAQAVYISIAVTAYILSLKSLGGIMKKGILLIIFALLLQYVADFTFVYQSSRGTYVPGKIDDLFYLAAYFAMASALLKFNSIYASLRQNVSSGGE